MPCSDVKHTIFNDLYRGIYSTITDPGAAAGLLKVANCSFNDVRRSVYLCGHQNAEVIFNTIELNQIKNDTAYGIYTNGCTFYTIEENTITGPSPLPLLSYGIIINNSVGANNEKDDNLVYRNWLNNLQYGTVSMRRNANSGNGGSTPHGLEFRCNQYNNVSYAIAVFAPLPGTQNATIKHKQGDTNDPAANKFEISTAQWSLWKSSIPTPTYFHHNVANYDPANPGTHVSNFVLMNTNYTEVSCPSHFDDGGGAGQKEAGLSSEQIKSQIEAYELKADSLIGLIDGGNTAELIFKANDVTINSEQLKSDLLSVGPFLSDTVLNASLTRSNPMKNSDAKEVIMTNSPVEDTVYKVLEAEKPVVAANIAVVNAQEGVSDRSNLIAEAGNLYLKSYVALRTLRDYYEDCDSVNSFYQYLLEQEKNQYAICYAFQLGDNGIAQAMISQMDESDLKSWYQFTLDKKTSGASLPQVTTEELNWIKSIADEESISGLLALNLLTLIEGDLYYEDFPVIDESDFSDQKMQATYQYPTLQNMLASPNPANRNVFIQFSPEFESKGAQLVLTDAFGKEMQSIIINDDFSTLPISLVGLPSGFYLLQLKSDGILLVTEKIIVE